MLIWCEQAWLPPGRAVDGVLIEVTGETITELTPGAAPGGARRLPGLTLPGMANAHSHAFHRALRGRAGAHGSFWTWREEMYAVAARLDPDSYLALARATYGEMVLAGITCVGEFHYLHHGPGGIPYADPNAMGLALMQAAAEAGLRITLLDTCYLAGGLELPLQGIQERFGDGDANRWAERVGALSIPDGARRGAAVHSVRAVPGSQLSTVATWATDHRAPLHVHLSEQPAENDACRAAYGCTPTDLLVGHGVLGAGSTAVHATHLTDGDIALLASSGTGVCFCPTTERDLGDGIGPARRLADAGVRLSLGSDGQTVIDPFEEARGLEMDERLASGRRGHFDPAALVTAASATGHAALGWPEAGRLEVGAIADLVTVATASARTAGAEHPFLVATAADVTDVVVGGRVVVGEGEHLLLGDVGRALDDAIGALR